MRARLPQLREICLCTPNFTALQGETLVKGPVSRKEYATELYGVPGALPEFCAVGIHSFGQRLHTFAQIHVLCPPSPVRSFATGPFGALLP